MLLLVEERWQQQTLRCDDSVGCSAVVGAAVRAVRAIYGLDRRFNSLNEWLISCVLQGLPGATAAGGEMAAADPTVR